MRRYQSPISISDEARGATAAIGNFDGVHKGHQSIITQARDWARVEDRPLAVMTFEPHPRDYFAALTGQSAPALRLMTAETRARRLESLGVDILFEIPFDADLAALSDEAFAREKIVAACGISRVVVGQDFRFGRGRRGDGAILTRLGQTMGFEVRVCGMFDLAGERVSSTLIRTALSEGRVRDAASMLGQWHQIEGPVLHGEKRGRALGYPTANLAIADLHQPYFGVYAVIVEVLEGAHAGTYSGVSSIGVRPMFGQNAPNCETFIFDFDGDLYGTKISVGLVELLRPEQKFTDLDQLVFQMGEDSRQARLILDTL